MLGKLLLLLLAFGGGLLLYYHNQGLIPTITANLQTTFEPAITFVKQNAVYVGAAFTGITTLGALLARKISSLTQTKNAINEQNQALQSNLANTNIVNSQISEELKETKQKLSVYEGQFGGDVLDKVQNLSTQLQDAQRTITTQQDEIKMFTERQSSLEAENRYWQDMVKRLEYERDLAKGIIKPPIE